MMKLGIIGAENSHTAAIAKELDTDRLVAGFRVTHVWGDCLRQEGRRGGPDTEHRQEA